MLEENIDNRKKILNAVSKVIKNYRIKTQKSITLISYEVNLAKSVWSDVESGKSDMQLTTFWRIAEALDTTPEELIKSISQEIDQPISFIG